MKKFNNILKMINANKSDDYKKLERILDIPN